MGIDSSDDANAVELSGWLIDRNDGLYILDDHFPLDWDFPGRVKIVNGNIMWLIKRQIAFLGGGKSSLFHKCRAIGTLQSGKVTGILIKELFVQSGRVRGELEAVLIDEEKIKDIVSRFGDYQFYCNRDPMSDWLDDYV
jgi:hypothetical protein